MDANFEYCRELVAQNAKERYWASLYAPVEKRGALYALYGRALRETPELAGKVVLEFTIAPSGEITMCRVVSSELNDPELGVVRDLGLQVHGVTLPCFRRPGRSRWAC